MKKSQVKPWLNEDGSVKSDAELQEVKKNWQPSVWREYLDSLEVGRREEYVLPPAEMDAFSAEECAELLFSMAGEERHHLLKVALKSSIRQLTPKQRKVIIGYYWEDKTVAEIAADMGVTTQSVYKTMKISLSKLKASLTSGSLRKRIMAVKEILVA